MLKERGAVQGSHLEGAQGFVRPPGFLARARAWLERVDPGTHRRIKGLRLVTAYGIAAMLGTLLGSTYGFSGSVSLGYLAAGFALWASVSEGQTTRALSSRDLAILTVAAAFGAITMMGLAPWLGGAHGRPGSELVLVTGAFLVGYLRRFGTLGAGVGSQIYIGQLLAYGYGLTGGDVWMVALAAVIAAVAAIVPRVLSGPAEHPAVVPIAGCASVALDGGPRQEFRMGLQAAVAALAVVALNQVIRLPESAWAITACTYVIAGSATGTVDRVRRRIVGTMIGVPLGIACLPIALHAPPLAWMAAALAMIIYAMALPERYDIACAAYAFTLMVTLAVSGEHSIIVLAARAWETLLGGALGVVTAKLIFPLRTVARRT
jgi:Fusaric acid resistance protein-like